MFSYFRSRFPVAYRGCSYRNDFDSRNHVAGNAHEYQEVLMVSSKLTSINSSTSQYRNPDSKCYTSHLTYITFVHGVLGRRPILTVPMEKSYWPFRTDTRSKIPTQIIDHLTRNVDSTLETVIHICFESALVGTEQSLNKSTIGACSRKSLKISPSECFLTSRGHRSNSYPNLSDRGGSSESVQPNNKFAWVR